MTFKEYYIIKEGWLDKLQVALDVIGFEPTVGTVAATTGWDQDHHLPSILFAIIKQ